MRIIFALVVIFLFSVERLTAQQGFTESPDPDQPDYYPYFFNLGRYLRENTKLDKNKVITQNDSLELFLADSIQFHKWNTYNLEKVPHVCQNRYYKFGFVGTEGEIIIPFEYDWLQAKYDSLMLAEKAGAAGVINNQGKTIIPFNCNTVYVKESSLLAFTKSRIDSSITFCDSNGGFLYSVDGYAARKLGDGYITIFKKDGGFKGVINYGGKWIVKPETYPNVKWIKDGFICTSKKGLDGVINFHNKIILPFEYKNISPTEKKQFIVYKDGMSGVLNAKNKFVIPLDSMSVKSFGVFYIVSKYRSNVSKLINEKGQLVLAEKYNIYIPQPSEPGKSKRIHSKSVIQVVDTSSRLTGMYRADGVKILPIDNSYITYKQDYAVIITQKKLSTGPEEYAAIDIDGKMVVPFSQNKLQFIERSPKLLLATNPNKKSAFVNAETGEVFTSFEYEYVSYENILTDGYLAAKKNWLYALISPEGKMLTDVAYSRFYRASRKIKLQFTEEIVCIGTKNNKSYGITKTGKEIPQIFK